MNKQLHLCWLIDEWKASREQYLQAWVAAGWDVVLWHSGQLAAPPVSGVELRLAEDVIRETPVAEAYAYEHLHRNHAGCADLFRYQTLSSLGGSYVDIDVLPGSGCKMPDLEKRSLPCFDRSWYPRTGVPTLNWSMEIRFIFTPAAGHPLLERIRDVAVRNETSFLRAGGYTTQKKDDVIYRTGPNMALGVVQEYVRENRLRLNDMTLANAVLINTKENCKEHYSDRWHETLHAVKTAS